jgi:hypothetical protein
MDNETNEWQWYEMEILDNNQGFRQKKISGWLKKDIYITPWWVLCTLKCLILLLNALKLHLKLVKVIN